jgi:putative glutamine amidotransferase
MKPLIAVAGRPIEAGRVGGWRSDAVGLPVEYLDAIQRTGAQEAILRPVELSSDEALERLSRFDGLLLVGGGDLDPLHYGEDSGPEVYGIEPVRDAFELALARGALQRGLPMLAICRGMQVLNVAAGGTLVQHLPSGTDAIRHGDPTIDDPVHHPVMLEPGSRVAKAMGVERADCSSHHHQAVAHLGTGFAATGHAEDGVVEAIERDEGWTLGVQWHPEDTCGMDPAQQGLFDALAAEAAGR